MYLLLFPFIKCDTRILTFYFLKVNPDGIENSVVRKKGDLKGDIVTKIEKNALRWFENIERVN